MIIHGRAVLSAVVLPQITGDFLDVGDPLAVRATGETLARVHLALAQLDAQLTELPRPVASEPLVGAEPRLLHAGAAGGRERAPRAAARLDALLADLPDLDVPPALVHGDVRGANVLLDAGQVSALLDYDSMRLGHRVHDLAAGAVKLATRFRSWDPPPPTMREHLVAGYDSVAGLTSAEKRWLEAFVLAEGQATSPDPLRFRPRRMGVSCRARSLIRDLLSYCSQTSRLVQISPVLIEERSKVEAGLAKCRLLRGDLGADGDSEVAGAFLGEVDP